MKFNKKIQKLALATSVLFASLPSYSLSGGGIAGVTIGTVAAAAVIGTVIGKSEKRKRYDRENCSTCKKTKQNFVNTAKSKKDLKHDLHHYRHDLRRAKSDLRSSKRNDNKQKISKSTETMKHESIVAELERMVENLKTEIKNMV